MFRGSGAYFVLRLVGLQVGFEYSPVLVWLRLILVVFRGGRDAFVRVV